MNPRIVIASECPTDYPRLRSEDGGIDVAAILRLIFNFLESRLDDPDALSLWLNEPLVKQKFNLNECEVWSDVCPQDGTRLVEDGAVPEYSIEETLLRAPNGDWWMIVQRFYWECDEPCAGAWCFKVPLPTVCNWFLEHSQLPPLDISSLVEDQVIGGLPRDAVSENLALDPLTEAAANRANVSAAKNYLWGWVEIAKELGQKNDETFQRRLRDMHDRIPSPIVFRGQGSPPMVDRAKLIEWWNSLEERLQELTQMTSDRRATTKAAYPHGRNEIVLPDLKGHVKRRRGKP